MAQIEQNSSNVLNLPPGGVKYCMTSLQRDASRLSRKAVLRLWFAVLIFAITVGVAFSQTATSPESANEPPQSGSASSPIVDANTRFAFKLLSHLVTRTPAKNVLVAPTGISLAFGWLNNGADPNTREEIETVFEFKGLAPKEINEGCAALRADLKLVEPFPPRPARKIMGLPPRLARQLQLHPGTPNGTLIADSLWTNSFSSFDPNFIEVGRRYYRADLEQFLVQPSHSIQVGNWASKRTGTRVRMVVSPVKRREFLLVDVTHFRGLWRKEFQESATKPDWFTLISREKRRVPLMHQHGSFRYLEGPAFQAVALPYWEHASMYVLLPNENSSLAELEHTLSAENWTRWLGDVQTRDGHVALPRFQIGSKTDIKAVLQALGLRRAFQELDAFEVAVPNGGLLKNAVQRTNITVDERSTEAISIATFGGIIGGIEGGRMPGERPKPFEMIVNRPFFFAIRDDSTGQLLFLGAVVEP